MFSFRKDKHIYLPLLLVALALISIGTWRDMNRDPNTQQRPAASHFRYFVETQDALKRMPSNNIPAYLQLGTFTLQNNVPSFAATDIAPVHIPQQEVNLVLTLRHIPTTFMPLLDAAEGILAPWHKTSNAITEIVVDYQPDGPPELDKLDVLMSSLRRQVLQRRFWLGLSIKRQWLLDDLQVKTKLANISKHVRTFIFDLDEVMQDGETLDQAINTLNEYGLTFSIRADRKPDDPIFALGDKISEARFFVGFLLPPE